MLKKGSGEGTTKQAVTADYYGSLLSPTKTSCFCSPRLLSSFVSKGCIDSESMTSPTSILDTKPFSASVNLFCSDINSPKTQKPESKINWDRLDSRNVGLGLVDALSEENPDSRLIKPNSKMVLFASQLKIQIPTLSSSVVSPINSPKSLPEFGIKTRNSLLGPFSPGFSPASLKKPPFSSSNLGMDNPSSPQVLSPLSVSEMELSEEYTCVISRGPNPRTTHIFDDCIVGSCCGVSRLSKSSKGKKISANCSKSYPSENFLSFCYYCKKNLGQGQDIYIYRGEKAFCSSDCRHQEMMLEEEIETPEFDDL